MDLNDFRRQMDEIDQGLVGLFERRMDLSAQIGLYKMENNLPVYDPAREQQKLKELAGKVKEGREPGLIALYTLLFELSRSEQEGILNRKGG